MFTFKVNATITTIAQEKEGNYTISKVLFSGKHPKKFTVEAIKKALNDENISVLKNETVNVDCEAISFSETIETVVAKGLNKMGINYDFIVESDAVITEE